MKKFMRTMLALATGFTIAGCDTFKEGDEHIANDRVMLVYHGAPQTGYRPQYQQDSLIRYLVGFENEEPRTRITKSVVLLDLYAPISGQVLVTWGCKELGAPCANGQDWDEWLKETMAFLPKLDSAAARADELFGPRVIDIIPMLIYPDPHVTPITFGGKTFDLSHEWERLGLITRYIDSLEARWARLNVPHLQLKAYYWLYEGMSYTEGDRFLLPYVSEIAHSHGRELWWIPAWGDEGQQWRKFGFDRAWLQPNYFFNPDVPDSRLSEAQRRAARAGMGLELEFERGTNFSRLDPYFEVAKQAGSLAIYEGGGALLQLEARDPERYRKLVDILGY